jgi:hypothetical protein
MRRWSSLPVALAAASLAAGCGASTSNDSPKVTMNQKAAAAVAHAEAVAEGAEGNGYDTLAAKARQSTQNGYERIKRSACRRLHPHAPCRVGHVKLLNH